MPRELITIQVGQCGNQIGMRFWDLALQEHASYSKSPIYDDPLSSFFRNQGPKGDLRVGDQISQLKARALVVDMEEGVLNSILKSSLGELFDQRQFIQDVSGSGNNWAQGFHEYGHKYQNQILDKLRFNVEKCDSLQCFFMTHSLGGGTGSGLGSFLLSTLEDHYPEVFRFSASVFPSNEDDVVTSPYNSLFSLYELSKHADCVFPIDNQALINIIDTVDKKTKQQSSQQQLGEAKKPFDRMNNLIAQILSHITCSMRFEGTLNVDLNEITMNLVPFPDLHFLISSLAPLYTLLDKKLEPRRFEQIFQDIQHPDYQMICANPAQHKYLAMGLILRGKVAFSDVNMNIKKLKDQLNMVQWNKEGFKYGICNNPPIGQNYSMLALQNNTCIRTVFGKMVDRFQKLYKKKVYVHHYTEFMDQSHFAESCESIQKLMGKYQELETNNQQKNYKRLKPIY